MHDKNHVTNPDIAQQILWTLNGEALHENFTNTFPKLMQSDEILGELPDHLKNLARFLCVLEARVLKCMDQEALSRSMNEHGAVKNVLDVSTISIFGSLGSDKPIGIRSEFQVVTWDMKGPEIAAFEEIAKKIGLI